MHANLKKKFGQNFLIDKNILNKIINLVPKNNLNILEIGPGSGNLTELIINKNPAQLNLIEIDSDLTQDLNLKFNKYKFIKIMNEDVLCADIDKNYDIIISNLPYNISSQILSKIVQLHSPPEHLILMFQKEFADRLLSSRLNAINTLVNCFYKVKHEFNISKNCFRPIPKVDSTLLSFYKHQNLLIKKDEIEKFINFKRKVFSHKRKTLQKVFRDYQIDVNVEIDKNLRIENLSLFEFISIFRKVNF